MSHLRALAPLQLDRIDPVEEDMLESFATKSGMAEGRRIGPYRIFEAIGRGGMGVVYRARHATTQRAVALKTVHSAGCFSLDGLRREIIALTTIRHPGIVRIVDHGTHEGLPWYAMDLLEGESLRRFGKRIWSPYRMHLAVADAQNVSRTDALSESVPITAEAKSPPAPRPVDAPHARPAAAGELSTVLSIMRRVCATLAFLHGEGFINCDLKPENTLLVNGTPVLIDFGLTAHHPGGSGREWLEAQRAMWGTLEYMPPERIRGELVDARSDLYSVGCILYELVVGEPPFTGAPPALMRKHQSEPPVAPSTLVEGVPPELDRTILKLLSKQMSDRFGYADEVATVLASIALENRRLAGYPPGRAYLYRPRFVGRSRPLEQLVELRERAAAGMGAFVLIGGESGVGKTRLAMELTRIVPSSHMRIVTSEASPLGNTGAGRATPLQALRSLLRAVADHCHEGGADVTDRLLGTRRSVLALYEPLLAHVPAHDALEPVAPLPASPARQRLFRYLTETLAEFSRDKPLLWVLDDIGWADELSLAYLASVPRADVEENRLFIVGTYRSEELSAPLSTLLELPHVVNVDLTRLDADEVRSMVRDMLALPDPPERFVRFVERQTEGNPFFVSEYLRAAVTDQLLYRDEDTWCLPDHPPESGRDIESLPLPRALRELIDRRLHKLTPAALHTGLAAAVLGREFLIDVLREVTNTSEETFAAALGELIRRQVVEPVGTGEVRFAHDKLREVAYAEAPAERLRDFHSRAATALEARWQAQPDVWATLGHHFSQSQQVEQAAHYLKLAADHARETHANAEAIELYRAAIEQAQQVLLQLSADSAMWQERLVELHEALGDVLSLTAKRDEARVAYADALAATTQATPAQVARLHRKTGKTWEGQHQHDDALQCYGLAKSALGGTSASPDALSLKERNEWIMVHIDQLWVYYWLGNTAGMEEIVQRLRPLVETHGSAQHRVRFYQSQLQLQLRRDRYVTTEETLAYARAAVVVCEESGVVEGLPMARFNLGFALLWQDSFDSAIRELQVALELAERAGDVAHCARCLSYLALAARRLRRVEDAAAYAERSANAALAGGMRDYVAAAHAHQAWVALQTGAPTSARHHAEAALSIWDQLALAFPMQWIAVLTLLHLDLQEGRFDHALERITTLLAPTQQPLPGDAMDALARAARCRDANEPSGAKQALTMALCHLEKSGYL